MMGLPEDRDPKAIARRLRATRLALGYKTQRAFCLNAGIEPNTYNQWEKAKGRPDLDNAIKLCDKYEITLDWIYFGDAGKLPHDLASKIEIHLAAGDLDEVIQPPTKGMIGSLMQSLSTEHRREMARALLAEMDRDGGTSANSLRRRLAQWAAEE